jgi:hypothetical protein
MPPKDARKKIRYSRKQAVGFSLPLHPIIKKYSLIIGGASMEDHPILIGNDFSFVFLLLEQDEIPSRSSVNRRFFL